jgi:hypothetical protein
MGTEFKRAPFGAVSTCLELRVEDFTRRTRRVSCFLTPTVRCAFSSAVGHTDAMHVM